MKLKNRPEADYQVKNNNRNTMSINNSSKLATNEFDWIASNGAVASVLNRSELRFARRVNFPGCGSSRIEEFACMRDVFPYLELLEGCDYDEDVVQGSR